MGEMLLFGTYQNMHAGVSVGSAWYFNSAYFDGNYLFWSAFQRGADDQVSLYAVDLLNTGETFMLGQFPVDVWPVGGLHQNVSAPPAGNNSVDTSGLTVVLNDENPEYDISAYVASKKQTPAPNASARPMSDAVVEEAQDMITVKVTAGDLAAAATDRFTNGVTSVSYDAEALELKSVIVNGDYVASVKEEGKVTFGYVDLDGVAPDTVVATLVFDAKSADAKPVKITYIEANNEKPASSEDVNVDYPHEHTEVQNAKEATCTEPGYTGDVYCHDCKTIIVKGEEIKPTGHQNTEIQGAKEATCTEPGYTGDVYCHDCKTIIAKGEEIKPTVHQNTEIQGAKEATYTEPGYTGDTYCHDCKTVVAKGKEIPVKKVEGEGPPKTDDPFSFGMGFVLMMTSVSAMAVLTVVYKKKYRA
jgi:RNase P subunit RPR2